MERLRCLPDSSKLEENDEEVVSRLPDEWVIGILERLPVKSLNRFRCVTKSWCSLFKDRTFIKNHSEKQGKRAPLLLISSKTCNLPVCISRNALSFPDLGFPEKTVLSFHDLDFPEKVRPSLSWSPWTTGDGSFSLVGSCNGIVCITHSNKITLCNPAMREFKCIPIPDLKGELITTGFGVASCGYDFKFIAMQKVHEKNLCSKTHLYSSRSNSWRQIDGSPDFPLGFQKIEDSPFFPVGFDDRVDNVFLNGSCYWLVRGHLSSLVCFDIDSEIFGQLELPGCIYSVKRLIVMNECLGVGVYSGYHELELWVMKEHGVEKSWTKMSVIFHGPLSPRIILPWKDDILMVWSKYMVPVDQLESYSLCTNKRRSFRVYATVCTMDMLIYEESLVSLT